MRDQRIRRSVDRVIGNAVPGHPQRARVAHRETSGRRRIYGFLRSVAAILTATIREIFDESAYERYLAQTVNDRSVASYRAFLEERETGIDRRPRCC